MKSKKVLRLTLFVLILATILAFPSINSFASGMILGDMNNDGAVNSNDAIYLLRHTLAPVRYPISQSGNIDGANSVNSDDAIYLLRHTLAPEQYPIKSCTHNWVEYEAKSPTCTDKGWYAYEMCSICLDNNYVEIPALGHDMVEVGAKEPTCTTVGWYAYEYCSRGDINTYEEIDVIPHSYKDGSCTICGESYISPNGFHAHKNKVSDAVASTCCEAGHSESIICTACGKALVAETPLPLLPHTFENGVCTVCDTPMQESTGLAFEEYGDMGYTVSGIGECTDTQIIIPSAYNGLPVVAVDFEAFKDNLDIVQVVIPSSVKTINTYAFMNCQNLASVTLNEGLEVIDSSAFMYCISLKSIDIPDSVTTLGTAAFIACYGLEEATVGSGITKISNDAFFECYSMETLNINASITAMGSWALYDCDSLTAINYAGSADEWDTITYGKYWDENSGTYTVYCQGGETMHKHIYDAWVETGEVCEFERTCTVDGCGRTENKYDHTVSNSGWIFTSTYVAQICEVCGAETNRMDMNRTVLKLDFDQTVSSEIASYPSFTLVSDGKNAYETVDGRSVWGVNSTTWIDYDKAALESLEHYVIIFDIKTTAKPAYSESNNSGIRDNSVFSFIPGMNGGKKAGTSVAYIWQLKYVPLLDKLATLALNGTTPKYITAEDIPEDVLAQFNESTSVSFVTGEWATVTIICETASSESQVFVNGTYIGKMSLPNHNSTSFADAFSIRFVDNVAFGTKIDNFRIQELVLD